MTIPARIVDVTYLRDYIMRLTFRDGFTEDVNFEPFMRGPMSNQLRDIDLFKQVRIAFGGLEWPNGYDICPGFLRDHLPPANACH